MDSSPEAQFASHRCHLQDIDVARGASLAAG
jgi:hypothetical protein